MTDLSNIRLFSTHPHECSYLDDAEATTIFVDPDITISQDLYSQLSLRGFRRSGEHIYRPHCASCQACTPARIPVEQFKMSRQQKRCWKRNQDLRLNSVSSLNIEQHYPLYERYINARHQDGDMYPATQEQFESFLASNWGLSTYLEYWREDELLAVAVTDQLEDSLSAVYTFFEPTQHKRSLGVFCLLSQIEMARKQSYRYLYLGYWIKDCQKMSYKTDYQPVELLINGRWRLQE